MFSSRLSPSAIELPPLRSVPDRPIVCYVTDGRNFSAADRDRLLLKHLRLALEARVDWIQIREKDISAKRLLALTREALQLASAIAPATRILVNDRLDVAIAVGAAGAHLAGESLSIEEVVRWCRAGNAPADFLLGVSCHSIEEVTRAASAGADYAFFGPMFDTPSKRSFGAPQGVARLGEACRAVRIPVIAIGGIAATNAIDCVHAGAKGVAAIRLFQGATEAVTVRDFISQLGGQSV